MLYDPRTGSRVARDLPPLNALRAFEAAARHLSFTRGARELHVTQAAVSHQVRGLEEHLGLRLFRRGGRSLSLTDEGQTYYPAVRAALDGLAEATAQLRAREERQTLTVSVLPSFAARWLVPRLGRFREAQPGIDVRVAPDPDVADFAGDDVDVGIRYGRGSYPGLASHRLMDEEVFPVCSPRLLAGPHPLREPADLRHHTLLHDETRGDWRTWLLAAGVSDVDPTRGPLFVDSSMLVQAAVEAQGVALARRVLAREDLAAGRLVRVLDKPLPRDFAYHIVYPDRSGADARVAAFRDWLLAEAEAETDHASGAPGNAPRRPGQQSTV